MSKREHQPMQYSKYCFQKTEKSFCPTCKQNVYLLIRADAYITNKFPAFYICFNCIQIAQTGVGPVLQLEEIKSESDSLIIE